MSTPDQICKDGASKLSSDDVCEMNDMLQQLSTADNSISICSNCGKEGSDVNNICNKCKMVKYCNAACKKKHRSKHKKQCEEHIRIEAEQAAKLHDIELFKQPPSQFGDCPICFLRLPHLDPTGKKYMTCCGKFICSGCVHAPVYDDQGNKVADKTCPFCRTPRATSVEEIIERLKKRVEAGDAYATYDLGCCYRDGEDGYPQDFTKAFELFHRAAELGQNQAYCNIGHVYDCGRGVEIDKEKANHYYELAAMGGNETARYNLGNDETRAGNMNRAIKHYMIAVGSGHNNSLQTIQRLYSNRYATKEDYTKALQFYQAYLGEIKSEQRDEAAAADDQYRYY